MDNRFTTLFADFDNGKLTRRQLMQALGLAAIAAPAIAFGQGGAAGGVAAGGGGGRGGAGSAAGMRAPRDTTPLKPPFEPTGWNTVWLDHFSYTCTDYKKAAAFYSTLMSWKVRSDDGKQAMLDIGDDTGGIRLRNGFVAPPPPPPRPAGDTTTGRGRGGGGGRAPARTAIFDRFCWGIDQWDTKKVQAALESRGLNPVADNAGSDFLSFHVKDPDGFDLQISNGNRGNRRKTPANGNLPAPAPFASPGWKTVWLDHISFRVGNVPRSVAFYSALLGWKAPAGGGGGQSSVQIGDVGGALIRSGAMVPGTAPGVTASIDHISFGIEPWNADAVEAELMKRGLGTPDRNKPGHLSADTGNERVDKVSDAKFQSYHTPDPFGWDLQISNVTRATR